MKYDVIIIGAGPAGYVAAIRAGQVGLKTALVEKKHIGGMCLNWGCIPTKAYIESAKVYEKVKQASDFGIEGIDKTKLRFNWEKAKKRSDKIVSKLSNGVEYLLKKNGVDIITGEAIISSEKSVTVENRLIEADHIIIATGSKPEKINADFKKGFVIELEQLAELKSLPESIAIFGTGPVSVEMAQLFRMLDVNVTLLATGKHLLPGVDKYLSDYITRKMKSDKIRIVYCENIAPGKNPNEILAGSETVEAEHILNCSWRKGIFPKTASGIKINSEKGYIRTNLFMQTNYPSIYAIGDVNGESYLAHSASAQGLFAINNIKGIKGEIRLQSYPVNVYSHPEMAQVGKTEQELKEMETDYKVSLFPLSANGKALTEGNSEGFVRILSEKRFGEVLGVQIVAPNATDMIAEASAFMSVESTVYDVAQTVHAHPTVSEIFMEAGFDAMDQAIHK